MRSRKSKDAPPAREAELEEMSPFAREIAEGLIEARNFLLTGKGNVRVTGAEIPEPAPRRSPGEIRRIRRKLGATQVVFAKLMNVSVKSVEAWESGEKSPGPPARRLLQLLEGGESLELFARMAGCELRRTAGSGEHKPKNTAKAGVDSRKRRTLRVPASSGKP